MKSRPNYQEILLSTTSRFSKNQFGDNVRPGDLSLCNISEQLEKACWNGLLRDMLPDIIKGDSQLLLWQIENHQYFLHISLGLQPPVIENFFTLDPDFFLCGKQMN